MPEGQLGPSASAAEGERLLLAGRLTEACDAFAAAIEGGATDVVLWMLFAQAMERLPFTAPHDLIRTWLLRLAAHPAVAPSLLYGPVTRYLAFDTAFADLMARARSPDFAFAASDLQLMADPLLHALLERTPPLDPALERVVTGARRALLAPDSDLPALRCAIARSAMAGEYALSETVEEAQWIEALDAKALKTRQLSLNEVASYASYRALHLAPWARELPREGWLPPFAGLIRLALIEPLAEDDLRAAIPQRGAVEDAVSKAVRAQYEENPYPKWQVMAPGSEPLPATIGRLHPRVDLTALQWPARPNILIAGCGTGRQAIECAQCHPDATILAIDLSLSSLSFAKRKAIEAGVGNIDFAQADLTTVDFGEERFDLVECVGVLHHLEHPLDGWRRLAALVRPGGLMKIGLYSRAARSWLVGLRETYGMRGDAQGIRAFRQQIMTDEPDHPILSRCTDFYSLSECRDLVFHVQETQFTLPEIAAALGALRLRFLGFTLQPDQLLAYDARFADDPPRRNLDHWATLEAEQPFLFLGMYQFWVMKVAA